MSRQPQMWAVVPVKRFVAAKLRLAPVLDTSERAEFARAMFADVLDALMQSADLFSGIAVVTSDAEAANLAQRLGAGVVPDEPERGINAAIARAVAFLRIDAGEGLMVVPSDIPQVTRAAFTQASLAVEASPSIAIAEAVDDGGTNLFACRPFGAVAPLFGEKSFDRHRRAALQAKVAVHVLRIAELSLDIDRPQNLQAFLALGSRTRAHDFLVQIGMLKRLNATSASATRWIGGSAAGITS